MAISEVIPIDLADFASAIVAYRLPFKNATLASGTISKFFPIKLVICHVYILPMTVVSQTGKPPQP